MNNKVQGAEHALKTMAGYYIKSLQQSGAKKQEIDNSLIEILSEITNQNIDETELKKANKDRDYKIREMLDSSLQLLDKMIEKQKIDLESISIIEEMIKETKKELYKEEIKM